MLRRRRRAPTCYADGSDAGGRRWPLPARIGRATIARMVLQEGGERGAVGSIAPSGSRGRMDGRRRRR